MSGETIEPIAMIERLVGIPTVSADSNLALIELVRDYLAGHGIESRITHDDDGRKANLFASVGPAVEGGVVLSGHTDVVPVAGQPWDSDPFVCSRRDGRLYGRGTADMKSFIALALSQVPAFKAAPLRVPIHFALSYDEEVGCFGAPRLLADIDGAVPRPAAAIIGEPTSMQLATAHKGACGFATRFVGREGHSSDPGAGLNAIECAGALISHLGEVAAELREKGPFDARFRPPHTTINVGMIEGGTAFNIVARECRVTWEFRAIPGTDPDSLQARIDAFLEDELLARMRARVPEAVIENTRLISVPPLADQADSPAEALVRQLSGANATTALSFGTEGGLFQAAGIPTVVFGPGDIAQAHKANEFIELAQVEACLGFLGKLRDWASV